MDALQKCEYGPVLPKEPLIDSSYSRLLKLVPAKTGMGIQVVDFLNTRFPGCFAGMPYSQLIRAFLSKRHSVNAVFTAGFSGVALQIANDFSSKISGNSFCFVHFLRHS